MLGLFYLMMMIPEINPINPPNSYKEFFDWMGMNEKKMPKHSISNLDLCWFFPEFVLLYKTYKMKPWFIPSKLLLFNLNDQKMNEKEEKEKGSFLIALNKKHPNQEEKEPTSGRDWRSAISHHDHDEILSPEWEKCAKTTEELDFFLEHYLLFQLGWAKTVNERMINNFKVYALLIKLIDPRQIIISSTQKKTLSLDIIPNQRDFHISEFVRGGTFFLEPIRRPRQKDGQLILYQTIGISLVHKSNHQTNKKYQEQRYVSKHNFGETISPRQRIAGNRDKNRFDLLVPENILSFRRRRKLRILICFNSKNRNYIDRNPVFSNETNVKNRSQVLYNNNHLDREKNQLMKVKLFLWPNYRLEDLACMNRYWFDTNNGSRFNMLRTYLYPRLKIY